MAKDDHRQCPDKETATPVTAAMETAQSLQNMFAIHAGENMPTLAKALQLYRSSMPQPVARRLDEVNKAATYNRHHVVVDSKLVDEVKALLNDTAKPELGKANDYIDSGICEGDGIWEPMCAIGQSLSHTKEEHMACKHAFTHTDTCKLDTGEDYVRLPLSTYMKVIETKDDKVKVERISGCFSASSKVGWVPLDKLTLIPQRFVPVHVRIAERVCSEYVRLHQNLDKYPYLSAGPNSRTLCAEDTVYVKEVDAENANVTVKDEHGKHVGFGKIPTMSLFDAKVVAKPAEST